MGTADLNDIEFLIIGGGPAGLGAALRLEKHQRDWRLVEREPGLGGLSASFVDDAGFTWDYGGHVLFSHYETFDRAMGKVSGEDGWLSHERESWVWIKNRFVPYPFQSNLHRLDPADRWACVEGLLAASDQPSQSPPANFGEWITRAVGEGIAELFMRPYNYKVWAYPPQTMSCGWLGERVAVPELKQVLKSICTGEDAVSWGPNRCFRFPRHGGTGAIWQALGSRLDAERVTTECRVERIDAANRVAHTDDGQVWHFRQLISTAPLDDLIRMCPGVVDQSLADRLVYSTTHVVGVGMDGNPPESLATKNWMYFPEAHSPYYRVTVFSNYSPNNVARPGHQWSLMAEVAESQVKAVDGGAVVEQTLTALERDRLLPDRDQVRTTVHRRLPHGYPTPFLGRDDLVDPILERFAEAGIFSRGRFGAWKYEVANMDHSFAQGYECAERLIQGGDAEYEPTLYTPGLVNSRKNP